ncbi:MAG: Maf family nucleotide pyrophosphatase [Bacteroidota bacterium]
MQLSKKLILGSKSPRRKEILQLAGIDFEIRTANTEEQYPASIDNREVPVYLAQLKANDLKHTIANDEILLCTDTIVLLDDVIYGKPKDFEDAIQILSQLSGKTHEVISGVCLMTDTHTEVFSDVTEVTFNTLIDEDIRHYINTYKPFDKAGAYAIQEWIGLMGIEKIRGSYYNIVGLPIHKVIQALRKYAI